MLDSLLNTTVTNMTLSFGDILLSIGIALLMGILISLIYKATNDQADIDNFTTVLAVLPVLMCAIILLIGNNVAGAFSLAGIFSVVRFRSAVGNTKDIIYIMFGVGVGLACGIQSYSFAVLFTIVICIVLVCISKVLQKNGVQKLQLRILVPEDFSSEHLFDDLLDKYTKKYSIQKIRTRDLGSVYELSYYVEIPDQVNRKEFMDLLRCRNGNLNVSLLTTFTEE